MLYADFLKVTISARRVNSFLQNDLLKILVVTRNPSADYSVCFMRIAKKLPRLYGEEKM